MLDPRLRELLEMTALEPFHEWCGEAEPWTPCLAESLRAAGAEQELCALLTQGRIARGAADASPETPGTLLLRGVDDADALRRSVVSAVDKLRPGGRLLLHLSQGTPSKIIEATRDLDGLILRSIHGLANGEQVAFAVRPAERPRVLLIPDNVGACVQVRTMAMLERLAARGVIELRSCSDLYGHAVLADTDLVLFERYGGLRAIRLMLSARRLGVPTAQDIDDDLFSLPWFNQGAKFFSRFEAQFVLRALLRGAGRVVVSTPPLREVMGQHNSDVRLMENVVDTRLFTRAENHREADAATLPGNGSGRDEPVTLGYFGSRTHSEDFRPLIEPLSRLLRESNGRVRAAFVGHFPEELQRLPNTRYLGWFDDYHNAGRALSAAGIDIGVAPLVDLHFNRSKSGVKFMEYAACGIVGAFSDVEAYRGVVRDGQNGLLVREHTPAGWERALRRLIDDPAARKRMADQAHDDVQQHYSVDGRADRFWQNYSEVIESAAPAVHGSPAPSVPQEVPLEDGLTVVARLGDELDGGYDFLSRHSALLAQARAVTVVPGCSELAELFQLEGSMKVERLASGDQSDPIVRAIKGAATRRVLVLDDRYSFGPDLASALDRRLPAGCVAVGPRLSRPGSWQDLTQLPGLEDRPERPEPRMAQLAETRPVDEVPWLETGCLMIDVAALRQCGGLNETLIWQDALLDLGRRGTCVVANDLLLREREVSMPAETAARRRASRADLASWVTLDEAQRHSDPARIFGLEGETLEVLVAARPASPYLHDCLDRIARYTPVPHRVRVLHEAGDEETVRCAESMGAIAEPYGSAGAATGVLDVASNVAPGVASGVAAMTGSAADWVVPLHDGMLVTPHWIDSLLGAVSEGDTVVVPQSNDGSPEQRVRFDRGLSPDEIDRNQRERAASIEPTGRRIAVAGLAGALISTAALRSDEARAQLEAGDTIGWLRSRRPRLAPRSYVHVLDVDPGVARLGVGGWTGGPYDRPPALHLPDASNPAAWLQSLKPLLEGLREHPGAARILAAIGLHYVARGDLENGMSFLERALRFDPWNREIAAANDRAREVMQRTRVAV